MDQTCLTENGFTESDLTGRTYNGAVFRDGLGMCRKEPSHTFVKLDWSHMPSVKKLKESLEQTDASAYPILWWVSLIVKSDVYMLGI